MWEDPIVAEVHRTREKLAAQYNFDIKAFFVDLHKRQIALGARLVRQQNQPNQELQTDALRGVSHNSKSPQATPRVEL